MIRLFEVGERDVPSFQARIRHLRNFNCPPIENPRVGLSRRGGAPAEYSRLNVIQLAVALALATVGVSPKSSAAITLAAISDHSLRDVKNEQRPKFLLLFPSNRNPAWGMRALAEIKGDEFHLLNTVVSGTEQLVQFALGSHATSAINLTRLVSNLDGAVQQVLED